MDKQFLELLEKFAPAIRDAILAGIYELRDTALLTQIIEMVERGDAEGALRALGYNPALFNGVYIAMIQAFEAGGMLMMAGMPRYTADATGMKTMLRFNVRDRDAEKWLREQSSSLITGIEDDIRVAVRDTLQDGLAQGRNPRNVALDLVGRYDRTTGHREGGVIGLSQTQQGWARSVRQRLTTLDESYFDMSLRDARFDDTVRAAIKSGKPLPRDVVDKLTDRYRARALKHRGEMIGRTEALHALNRSEFEATKQALAQSALPTAAAKKVWDSAGDNRVRDSHREMDGQIVGIEEPFVAPSGARLMHPGDTSLGAGGKEVIACRCRVRYDIRWGYGLE